MGQFSSLDLDSSDRPHIAYYDASSHDLKYAIWNGADWLVEVVCSDGDVGGYCSIALDSFDYPCISFHNATDGDLQYARWGGSSWQIETVDSLGEVGSFTSIALDSSGYAHITYQDYSNDLSLNYAWSSGTSWNIQVLSQPAWGQCTHSSLALNQAGSANVSFTSDEYGFVGYCGNLTAQLEVEFGSHGTSSIVLDPLVSYHPSIAYNLSSGELRLAKYDGSYYWEVETIDPSVAVGEYASLALSSTGSHCVAYYDETN